jgi:glycosyltransferase involved in cell wall biosynthesis
LAVDIVKGDVNDANIWEQMQGCNYLFHVAAHYSLWQKDRDLLYLNNVEGTRNILAAAQKLQKLAVFRMVGSLGVQAEVKPVLASYLELIGSIPRSEIIDHYAWADVFLLPSICEGSATVIYEALAAGIPVICTENAGSVIRDGIEGFIVPIRDHEAIADKLELLAKTPELRYEMSKNAKLRAKEFTLNKYKQRLMEILDKV